MVISERPTWELEARDSYPKLDRDLETDIAVVGGGICGILTAYFLLKAGKRVVLLEKDSLASGATMYTTAFITKDIDTDLTDLEKMLTPDEALMVWQSGQTAIEKFDEIVRSERIDCEFERVNYNTLAFTVEDRKNLYQKKEILDRWNIESSIIEKPDLGFQTEGILRLPHEAKFHPIKFLRHIILKIEEMGCKIYENTEITELKEKNGLIEVIGDEGKVTAAGVVVATYKPLEHPLVIKFKKGNYETYMMEASVRKGILKNGMYVDMNNPYYYFRVDPQSDHDRVILGGEDHRKEIKISHEKSYKGLENYLAKLIGRENFTITRLWDGPILEPSDGLPLIGEYAENKYIGTAFSGNGMTYGMIAGMLISDLILKKPNVWKDLYDPKRSFEVKRLLTKGRDYSEELYKGALKKIFKKSDK